MLRWREARAAVKRHVKRQLGQPVSGRHLDGHGQAAAHVAERKVLLRVIPGVLRCHVAVGFVRDQCVGIDRFPKLQNRGIGQNLTVFVPYLKLVRVLQDELDALPLAGLDVQGIGRLIRAVFHRDGDVGVPADRHRRAALFAERIIRPVGGDGHGAARERRRGVDSQLFGGVDDLVGVFRIRRGERLVCGLRGLGCVRHAERGQRRHPVEPQGQVDALVIAVCPRHACAEDDSIARRAAGKHVRKAGCFDEFRDDLLLRLSAGVGIEGRDRRGLRIRLVQLDIGVQITGENVWNEDRHCVVTDRTGYRLEIIAAFGGDLERRFVEPVIRGRKRGLDRRRSADVQCAGDLADALTDAEGVAIAHRERKNAGMARVRKALSEFVFSVNLIISVRIAGKGDLIAASQTGAVFCNGCGDCVRAALRVCV